MLFRYARIGLATIISGALSVVVLSTGVDADPPVRPNIVLIIADDLSYNLLQYMRNTSDMTDDGYLFTEYFDATPWCWSIPRYDPNRKISAEHPRPVQQLAERRLRTVPHP